MSRIIRIAALVVGLALIASACSSDNAEVDDALATLNQALDGLVTDAESFEALLHDLEMRIEVVDGAAGDLALDFGRVGPTRASFLPPPPDGLVTVRFVAESVDAAVPGTFRFFLAPEGEQLFDTRSLDPDEDYEVGPELEDGLVFVEPGVLYSLKIVYENPSAQEVNFLVPGGTLDPQAALPYVRNRCWCAAIPFSVQAGGTFTRVIQVGVGSDTPPGARALMVWPVVRVDA